MSYILDALRKSESERDRQSAPDIDTLHAPAPVAHSAGGRPTRWLAPALVAVLALNAGVLALWLLGDEGAGPQTAAPDRPPTQTPSTTAAAAGPAPASTPARATVPAPATVPAEPPSPASTAASASVASTVEARDPPAPTAGGPSPTVRADGTPLSTTARETPGSIEGSPVLAAPTRSESSAIASETSPAGDRASAADPAERPPLAIRELPQRIQRRIPTLEFATHIYGAEPAFREVTINGVRYAEGDRVEGMRLDAITETGVVFRLEDYRFEVSVLADWDY